MAGDIKVIANRSEIVAIADAVRNKTGTTGEMTLSGIVNGVNSITTQPTIQSLSVTSNGTYTAPAGIDGYSPITVNVESSGTSLETFHGIIARAGTGYQVGGGTVYYTSKEGTAGTAYLYDDISIEIDVAKNTWIVVEAPWASEVFTCTNCSSHGTYEYNVLDMEYGMTFLIKVTGDNFRVEE